MRWFRGFLGFLLMTAAFSSGAEPLYVVVSDRSQIKTLNLQQVAAIFLGKTRKTPQGVPVIPHDLNIPEHLKALFYDRLVGYSQAQIQSYWARLTFAGQAFPPHAYESLDELKQKLKEEPHSIGYIFSGQMDSSLRVILEING